MRPATLLSGTSADLSACPAQPCRTPPLPRGCTSPLLLLSPRPLPPQEPRLRRVHVRTGMAIRQDPERPEYHRAIAHWARPGGSGWGLWDVRVLMLVGSSFCPTFPVHLLLPAAGAPPGSVCGELVACSTGGQISSRLLSLRSANVLLEIPAAAGVLPEGSLVSALVLGDWGAMPVPEMPAATPLMP